MEGKVCVVKCRCGLVQMIKNYEMMAVIDAADYNATRLTDHYPADLICTCGRHLKIKVRVELEWEER